MRTIILILMILLSFVSCKKKPTDTSPLIIGKATLIFPLKDEVCISGTPLSGAENKIMFKWNSSNNADSYEITVKNLENGSIISKTTKTTELEIILTSNKAYSWFVTSNSSKTSSNSISDTWRFYNSGPGVVSHPPFPAEIISPAFGQIITATSGKVTLDWIGNDVDNDILIYDIYFGATPSPTLLKSQTESIINDVAVVPKTIYYWKVITKDINGNSSDSGLFQFKTE